MRFATTKALTGILIVSAVSFSAWADDNSSELSGLVGGGVGSKPSYAGAKESDIAFRPVLKLQYGAFFIGGIDNLAAAGWNAVDNQNWTLAVGVGSDLFPRQQSDDPHLNGLGDIDVTPRAFLSGSYHNERFRGGVTLSQDVGGNDQGFRLTSYAHLQWHPSDSIRLYAGPALSWGDGDYMQTQYGVTAEQAARSGLQRYDAGAGLEKVAMELGMDYQFNASWMAGVKASAGQLEKHAADSPITQRSAQYDYGLFVAWHF
ncbi:MipA/OmpV family protein [Pantoea sp. B65]|uniref:MipA/OmpV family protein n=1 Tax=Pantoea sp. B65 TaxID=2813359 RepID=UPI0039B5ADEB